MSLQSISNFPNNRYQSIFMMVQVVALLAIIALMSGCASRTPSSASENDQADNFVWPAPPAKPRIRYLGSLKSSESLNEGGKLNLRDWFLGKNEEESIALIKPYGVHSDSLGRVYVADTGIAGLVVFDLNKQSLAYWGTSGPGALKKPTGVTTDSQGNVYVSDVIDHRVVIFDNEGRFLNAYGGKDVLTSPVGLAFNDSTQQLYVVDSKQHQVIVFNQDGGVDFTIGSRGDENGNFNFPTNIALDQSGLLYIADTMNFRVQIFDQTGKHLKSFGKLGDGRGHFSRLKGIGIDSEGYIYTVDAAFNNVQIFNQDGQLMLALGQSGTGPGGFYLPAGAHVDRNNRIFIADQLNQRIQMFEYLGDTK
ncbi:6-bladed beta-propeller [Candidatus Thiodiazotropha sp. CDECU1]|uniref:6-bladed beta-propeller n=1 Tax=Candidatus Thiodiazotropha sp. CDECU1 TaxID=3065865 RepID=UPI00292DD87F|nr:6-bladed beta-propeller [Candidatus Thiodiazotropha sp. CDECU1]